MIPEGWTDGYIGDLIESFESGVSVNGENQPLKVGDKCVLKVSSVSYGDFDPKAAKVINQDELSRAKVNPREGQIIISRSNTEKFVGASAYIHNNYPDLFLPDKLWQTVPKENSSMRWLSYVLASGRIRNKLSRLATGTSGSMKNITQGELLSLKVAIPLFYEQERISKVLSTWDDAITVTEQLLENSQRQKQALMQSLLTKPRGVLDDHKLWSLKPLGLLSCAITSGSRDWAQYYSDSGSKFMRMTNLSREGIHLKFDDLKHVNVKSDSADGKRTSLEYGDILISITAELGKIGWVPSGLGEAYINQHTALVRLKSDHADSKFIAYLLSSDKVRKAINRLNDAGAKAGLNLTTIRGLKLEIPPLKEQQRVAKVLTTADDEIKTLQQKLTHLKQEKKALMQQLLTGKKRVKLDNATIPTTP